MTDAAEQLGTPLTFCQAEVNKENSVYKNLFSLPFNSSL